MSRKKKTTDKCEPFLSQDIDEIRRSHKDAPFTDSKFPTDGRVSIFDRDQPNDLEDKLRRFMYLNDSQDVNKNIIWQTTEVFNPF